MSLLGIASQNFQQYRIQSWNKKSHLCRVCKIFPSNVIEEVLSSPFVFLSWNCFKLGTLETRIPSSVSCFNTCPANFTAMIQANSIFANYMAIIYGENNERMIYTKTHGYGQDILPKSFSVDLITTWITLSTGNFSSWKQSSTIIICLGFRWTPKGSCKSTCPTRRITFGSLANHPEKNYYR